MATVSVELSIPLTFYNTSIGDTMKENQKPMNWVYIKQFHLNPPYGTLPREDSVTREYQRNMVLIKKTTTIVDYLVNKYLSGPHPFVLVPNDYPYYCDKHILHYLLWVHPSFKVHNNSQVEKTISAKLYSSHMKYREFVFFENYDSNKSIPEITHYHVFIHLE